MNYFEYFSEIEERFSRRRGSVLLLNTMDWALIETWREAGIPLEAVLRGIDVAFDRHDAKGLKAAARNRRINGLAWCAQAVIQAAEEMVDAATGAAVARTQTASDGFDAEHVAAFLERNAVVCEASGSEAARTTASRLVELAATMRGSAPLPLDELDRTLTVLEEKLFAALQASTSEQQLIEMRAQADRELNPYRNKMGAVQLRQVQQQFLHKRLLELNGLPRLSLFYMGHDD